MRPPGRQIRTRFLLVLGTIVGAGIGAWQAALAGEINIGPVKGEERVSLAIDEVPLAHAVAALAQASGTKIVIKTVTNEEFVVSSVLDDVTFEEGLRRLIGDNAFVLVRADDGALEIFLLSNKMLNRQEGLDPSSRVILPPTKPGGRGITQGEFEAARANLEKLDPDDPDREVVPGVTKREYDAVRASQDPIDPNDPTREVVPGVRLSDYAAARAGRQSVHLDDPNREVVPGVTKAEFDAARWQEAGLTPDYDLDSEVVPGVSRYEMEGIRASTPLLAPDDPNREVVPPIDLYGSTR